MAFLITGVQMSNRGAQSMLYAAVDQLTKAYPGHDIECLSKEVYDDSIYRFHRLIATYQSKHIAALDEPARSVYQARCVVKDSLRLLSGKKTLRGHYRDLFKKGPEIEAVIDVSGFAVGRQWNRRSHEQYIDQITFARKLGAPVYLMPQSFGPFDYDEGMKDILKPLGEALLYPRLVYAREQQGYDALKETFGLTHVRLSTDLVLQHPGIRPERVFQKIPEVMEVPEPECLRVGIVPNEKCAVHGDRRQALMLYKRIVSQLLDQGFEVVIFRHAAEDLRFAVSIKEMFADCDRVVLDERDLDCLAYSRYVRQFCFLICSRYHGIVHAYREGVPVVALGWAVKYGALACEVGQDAYAFDLTDPAFEEDRVLDAVSRMCVRYPEEQKLIRAKVAEIQKQNCFEEVIRDMREMGIR